jgi:cytochrome P450
MSAKERLPLVGALPQALRDPILLMERAAREHPGELAPIRLGPLTVYLATRPEHFQHILVERWHNFGKSGGMWKPMQRLLGQGIATSEGETWVRNRRLLQPLFSPKSLGRLTPTIVEGVEAYLDTLQPLVGGAAPVDIERAMNRLVQRIFSGLFFGVGLDGDEADRLTGAILQSFAALNLRLFFYYLPDWVPLPGQRALREGIAALDEALYGRIRERYRGGVEREDFVSLLVRARDAETGEGMDERQLRDELVTMFVAGNETTASALTWIFYVLSQQPEAEARVRAEIREVLGERRPTFEDLDRLSYTRMAIQEVMRLYPPAWFFPRASVKEDVIGKVTVPARSLILLCPYITHRDPEFWERPLEFHPERFAAEAAAEGARRPRFAYMPFGAGPRQCIGGQLAMTELQVAVVMMLQRYRLRLAPGAVVVPKSSISLRTRQGVPMIIAAAG